MAGGRRVNLTLILVPLGRRFARRHFKRKLNTHCYWQKNCSRRAYNPGGERLGGAYSSQNARATPGRPPSFQANAARRSVFRLLSENRQCIINLGGRASVDAALQARARATRSRSPPFQANAPLWVNWLNQSRCLSACRQEVEKAGGARVAGSFVDGRGGW